MNTPSPTRLRGSWLARCCTLLAAAGLLALSACNGASSPDSSGGSASGGSPAGTGTAATSNANDNAQPTSPTKQGSSNQFTGARPAGANGPKITFESLVHNFGTMGETDSSACVFKFTNTGDSVLSLVEVKPTCTCTGVTVPKREFQPGEAGTINVTFKPTTAGKQSKLIHIATNDPVTPTTTITVDADVVPFLTLTPPNIDFGVVTLGTSSTSRITIGCTDPTFHVRQVTTNNSFIQPRIAAAAGVDTGSPMIAAAGEAIVEVTVDPATPWGPHFAWMSVVVEGTPPGKTERVVHTRQFRVNVQVFGDLVANPDTFRAGPLQGESFSRTVRLQRTSKQPFRIVQATVDNVLAVRTLPRATVQINRINDHEIDLVLNAAGGQEIGPFEAVVNIVTDVPGEEIIKINISGRVRGPAG